MTGELTLALAARLSAWYELPVYVGPPETTIRGKSITAILMDEAYERYRQVTAAQDRIMCEWSRSAMTAWVDRFVLNEAPAAFKARPTDTHHCTDNTDASFWVYHPEHHTWTRINPTTALAEDTKETK